MKKNAKLLMTVLAVTLLLTSVFVVGGTSFTAKAAESVSLVLRFGGDTTVIYNDVSDKYSAVKPFSIDVEKSSDTPIEFTVIPSNSKFDKWTVDTTAGAEYVMDDVNGIPNANGLITSYEFSYIPSESRVLYCNVTPVYAVALNIGEGATASFSGTTQSVAYVEKGDDISISIALSADYTLDRDAMYLGTVVPTGGNNYTYTITDYQRTFEIIPIITERKSFTVNVLQPDVKYGSVSYTAGPYYKGSNIVFRATSNSDNGYNFKGYVINGVEITENVLPTFTYVVPNDAPAIINISTLYEKPAEDGSTTTYTVGVNAVPNISGYTYNATGAGTYRENSQVTVSFTSTKLNFKGWDKNGDGIVDSPNAEYSFFINSDVTLTPIAEAKTFSITTTNSNITISAPADGNNQHKYTIDEEVTLTYSTAALVNKRFEYWTNNGNRLLGITGGQVTKFAASETLVIGAVVSDVVIIPATPPAETVEISVKPNDVARGNAGSLNGTTLLPGSNTTLFATARGGYEFAYWEKDGVRFADTTSVLVENIRAGAAYVAVFNPVKCAISYAENDTSGGSISGSTQAYNGAGHTFTVQANKGYEIETITVNGTAIEVTDKQSVDYTISSVNDAQAIVVTYKKVGLSGTENFMLLVSAVMVLAFGILLIIVMVKKPNATKLQRLINAKRATTQPVTAGASFDETDANGGEFAADEEPSDDSADDEEDYEDEYEE